MMLGNLPKQSYCFKAYKSFSYQINRDKNETSNKVGWHRPSTLSQPNITKFLLWQRSFARNSSLTSLPSSHRPTSVLSTMKNTTLILSPIWQMTMAYGPEVKSNLGSTKTISRRGCTGGVVHQVEDKAEPQENLLKQGPLSEGGTHFINRMYGQPG